MEPMDTSNQTEIGGLEFTWSPIYQPQWDDQPEAYVQHGIVAWGMSRRLAKATDRQNAFKAYLGVQHFDPGHWHVSGEPRAAFFLSLFVHGRTIALRTFPICQDALAALYTFHATLLAKNDK